MTGLLLPPDASLTARPDTQTLQTLRPTLSVNKLAALLPTPDVTETNTRNAGQAGNAAIQGKQAKGIGNAANSGLPFGTTSTRETLSFAARTILDLLGGGARELPRAAATLMPAPPTAATAAALPAALAALVDHSGLFYESHLAAWVNGARTLAAVRQEPQAALGARDAAAQAAPAPATALLPAPAARPEAASAAAMAASATIASPADTLDRALAMRAATPAAAATQDDGLYARTPASHAAASAAAESAPRAPAPGAQTGTGPATTPQQGAQLYEAMARAADMPAASARAAHHTEDPQHSAPAGTAPAGPAVHPGAEGLVRQQLELLATQQFRWIGEVWPGTHMAWEIARDPVDDGDAHGDAQARTWSTRLLLELPELGTIEARLSLSPGGLGARLVADASGVASRFDDARGRLQERLAANGIELVQFVAGTGTPKAAS
ncbi:flagellar hook-length control protein FliK [Cupriavidus necator]